MTIRTYKVTLDSKNSIAPEPVFLRQGDKTGAVVIDATLMDNGSPVSLSDLTPMFKANTADGQAVIADSTGFNVLDSENGEFTYQVPNALSSVPGKIKTAYFSFSDADGSESTFDVAFIIKKAVDITKPQADEYITIIDGTLDSLRDQMNSLKIDFNKIINNYNQGDFYNKSETDNQYSQLNSEISNRPTSQMVSDMIERGFSNFDGGNPHTIVDLATLESNYPQGTKGVWVTQDTGHMYFWDANSNKWIDGGAYQARSGEDFTKNITRQKLNQFNLELNKGKRLAGTNDDGSIKISNADESAYVSFSTDDMTEGVLRVPIYSSFGLGQFIILADKNDKVIYSYGYQALIDKLNAGKNTQFFSFDGTAYIYISIKQLMASVNGTPAKILLGFPIEADKDHLNLYLKNSIRSENYMPWIKTDTPTLCYETDYGTAPKSRDSNGRIIYGPSTAQLVKKFNTENYPSGDLIISTPTEMPSADGTYNTGVFIYLTDANEKILATYRYEASTGQPTTASGVLNTNKQRVIINLKGVATVGATKIIMILPANIEAYYTEKYKNVFEIDEVSPEVKPTEVANKLTTDNFNIPTYVPFTSGEDTYLYFDNLLLGKNYYLDDIKAQAKGMLDDKVIFNKAASMNRDITYNSDYIVNVPMRVVPKQISGSYKILCIGESTTEADAYINGLKDYLDTSGADFTLLGTRKTDKGNSHEGYGGWGAGTLHYVQSALGKDNAFYNPETKIFDYDYYLKQHQEQELPDIVQINFGINDTNRFVNDETGKEQTQTQHIQFIIDQIKAKAPKAKFIIGLTHSAARWTNFNNVPGVNRDEISSLVKKTNADFGDREKENIYLNPMYVALDPYWDMQYEEVISNRNSTHKTYKGLDSHHPSAAGYANNAYSTVNAIKYALLN